MRETPEYERWKRIVGEDDGRWLRRCGVVYRSESLDVFVVVVVVSWVIRRPRQNRHKGRETTPPKRKMIVTINVVVVVALEECTAALLQKP